MALTGNKGEWSELYAFFRLLADGCLYSGDGKLNVNFHKYFPILKVFRNDAQDRTEYEIVESTHSVLLHRGNIQTIEVGREEFDKQAKLLLKEIKELRSAGEIPQIEYFLASLGEDKITAKSQDKADIRLVIHDLRTGTAPELGYSIKSRLGGNSTLINSNKDTSNFVYKVTNFPIDKMGEFNLLPNFRQKSELLRQHNAVITFSNTARNVLRANLDLLDTSLVKIIAECLRLYYMQHARTLEECCYILNNENPLNFNLDLQPLFYEYKIKQFLLAFALGMTVGTVWNGRFNANGGYIVIKEDGEIVSYHFFDRNDLEDYLFYNTYFDTPSTTRHQFGEIYQDDGNLLLKLNILVRFI